MTTRSNLRPVVSAWAWRGLVVVLLVGPVQVTSVGRAAACGFEIRDAEPALVFGSREAWEPSVQLGPEGYWGDLCNGTRPAEQAAIPDSFGQPTAPEGGGPASADASSGDRSVPIVIGVSAAIALAAAAAAFGRRRWSRP